MEIVIGPSFKAFPPAPRAALSRASFSASRAPTSSQDQDDNTLAAGLWVRSRAHVLAPPPRSAASAATNQRLPSRETRGYLSIHLSIH